MKILSVTIGGLALVLLCFGATTQAAHVMGARAQASPAEVSASGGHAYRHTGPYQWCADYNNMTGNCGFDTFAQCKAASNGNGGSCLPNPRATPAPGTPSS